MLSIIGNGMCFVCYKAGKGLVGEERAASLAAIKAKIEGDEVGRGKRKVTHRGKPNKSWHVPADASPKPGTDLKSVPEKTSICLDFPEDRDRKIYDALLEQAARLRRTPEQQILWMLQNALEQETGLLAEAMRQ